MPSVPRSSRRRFAEYRSRRKTKPSHEQVAVGEGPQPDTKRRDRSRSFATLFARLLGMLKGHRVMLAMSLGSLTIATICNLAMPASTKLAIDYVLLDTPGPAGIPPELGLPTDRVALLAILCAALFAVTIVSIGFGMWGRWHTTRLTKRLQLSTRRSVFDHAIRLPLNKVHQLKSGGVASILREDAGAPGELLFSMVYNPWRAVVQLVGTFIILAITDWRLLLGSLLLIPIVWYTHRSWIERLRPRWRDIRLTRQGIDAHSAETFGGMRVVRGFARERGESLRFNTGNAFMARQEIQTWWMSRVLEIAWQVLIPLGSTGVLLYGGWQVIEGNLTIGDLMMFTTYLLMLLGPVEALVVSATNIQNQLAGFDKVLDLLDEPIESSSPGQQEIDPALTEGRITLEGVWFTYPGSSEPALRGVDLEVPPGTTVALVGPSGSGKTTLCNLVARFYTPTKGRMLLDGQDTADIDLASFRRLLGVVEQDVFLFDGTVRDNIAYGRREASDDEVRAAAEAASAWSFIQKLEHKQNTLIGERGVRLSGGQKQRLAIARAILADPRILILDEATSNLDTESERLIQASLATLMRGRTSFVIAHRLSTIRHADLIVVIEDGQIVERGSHEELVDRSGRYAALVQAQTDPRPSGVLDELM